MQEHECQLSNLQKIQDPLGQRASTCADIDSVFDSEVQKSSLDLDR